MPYVVTQSCCSDASCVVACPVNCIHPAPGEPGFAEAEMLYVDPRACVDCGACATACPVGALKPHTKLSEDELPFIELNRLYYAEDAHADRTPLAKVERQRQLPEVGLRVAVVGAGPAGLYVADALLKHRGVSVDVFDRLPTPHGLVRAGVAPDHQHTKQVSTLFTAIENEVGFRYRLNVEVGRDIRLAQLRDHFHAVVYASGASTDRRLGIEGEDLPGSYSATQVVGWYNGQPDHQDLALDLTQERVVVVGNGNVALDVARVLTSSPDDLARTDLADQALAALRGSAVREVVVLGRRGPNEAAFTMPELLGLAALRGIDVVVETSGATIDESTQKGRVLAELAARPHDPAKRRIVLRFLAAPARIVGSSRVEGIEIERTRLVTGDDGVVRVQGTGEFELIETGVVLRSVGYRGRPIPDLPFDEVTGTVPHEGGRVEPGVYVAGWIKRGPSGFIGTNKFCAEETVETLLDDLVAGVLPAPRTTLEESDRGLSHLLPDQIGSDGWRAIDAAERHAGAQQGRPRVKITSPRTMVAVARSGGSTRLGRGGGRGLGVRRITDLLRRRA